MDGPPQPREGVELPAVETTYPHYAFQLVPFSPTHVALVFTIPGLPPVNHIYPMLKENAQNLGREMSAPRVAMPNGKITLPDGGHL